MYVKSVQLKNFKRFDHLTIDLGEHPKKVVALVGPNGSGKSSVLDGFKESTADHYGDPHEPAFASKSYYTTGGSQEYRKNEAVVVTPLSGVLAKNSFYIRTSYRYTAGINVESLKKLSPVLDEPRPKSSIQLDSHRTQSNYERLMGTFFEKVYDKDITGKEWAKQNMQELNTILANVIDVQISSLGNITNGEGQLWFDKGTSKKFPYMNLSSGEKEVLDIILDLLLKRADFNDTVYCIDEPELHLNTAIQRKLLIEIEKLIPPNCQLWIATHSIGFLRALEEDLKDKTAVVDFTGQNFDGPVTLRPLRGTRKDWSRIFETALEDMTGLMAPSRIVYCEGKSEQSASGTEQGLDAEVYNIIFEGTHHDTLFVSSGGGGAMQRHALLGLQILKKALSSVQFLLLRDRDDLNDAERLEFLVRDDAHRVLLRREIENYLFDKEILKKHCTELAVEFDEVRYDGLVTNITSQDLKAVQQQVQSCCSLTGEVRQFKIDLAASILPGSAAYSELESVIF